MDTVNENSTRDIEVTFKDKDGNLLVPDVAWYQLIDEETDTVIVELEDTEWNPAESTEIITIQAEENIILTEGSTYEVRVLHIRYFYNALSREENINFKFRVKNLKGVDQTEYEEGEGG